jgi:hypothetical protein
MDSAVRALKPDGPEKGEEREIKGMSEKRLSWKDGMYPLF